MLHNGDCYCTNCLHSFRTVKKLKTHEDICKTFDYCYIEMPEEDKNILKCNHGKKYLKVFFVIYTDRKYLIEKKIDSFHKNTEKSKSKLNKHKQLI